MKVMNSPWEVEPGFIAYIYIEILDPTSKSNPRGLWINLCQNIAEIYNIRCCYSTPFSRH